MSPRLFTRDEILAHKIEDALNEELVLPRPSCERWTFSGNCDVCGQEIHLTLLPWLYRKMNHKKCIDCIRKEEAAR